MAYGVPCQWCGFMEASHKIEMHSLFKTCIPCNEYRPLHSIFLTEIEYLMHSKNLNWSNVLPILGTNYAFARGVVRHSSL